MVFSLYWFLISLSFFSSWFVVTAAALSPPTPRAATRPSSRPTVGSSRPPTLKVHPSSLHLQPTLLHPMDPTLSTASLELLRAATTSLDPTVRVAASHPRSGVLLFN